MQLKEVIEKLNLKVVSGNNHLAVTVIAGYVSDILSDVMAKAKKGTLWITTQTHENVIAIVFFRGLAGVILPEGLEPDKIAFEKAQEKEIPVLLTDLSAFEVAGRLYQLGIRGSK